jgi:hypothetical protein
MSVMHARTSWLMVMAWAALGCGSRPSQSADAPLGAAVDAAPVDSSLPPMKARQAYIWIWRDYANSLDKVIAHAASFTHVSPALYQLNFDYQSGAARLLNPSDDFDGLSAAELCQRAHHAGLKCEPLIYAGAGNFGTDQGIHNILDDKPAGARKSFIDAMIAAGQSNGFDGYNLDWEVDNGQTSYAAYGAKLITFLTAFKAALNQHGMTVSFDLGTWYIRESDCSGGGGVADVTALGGAVDLAIIEAYTNKVGAASSGCPAHVSTPVACDESLVGQLDLMCLPARSSVAIGLIDPGSGPIVDDALATIGSYGYQTVAIWPDEDPFLGGTDWYTKLADYLEK